MEPKSALTLRLTDDKHDRLRDPAKSRGTTVNRLLDEAATLLISEFDAEMRFRQRSAPGVGHIERGLALMDKAQGDQG